MNIHSIRNSKPNTKIYDDEVRGLHLKTTPTGRKCFMLFYRTKQGRQRKPKIGEFGDITLAEARRRAKIILDKVAVGEDPKGKWDDSKSEMNVQELFDHTMLAHWGSDRYVASGWKQKVESLWKAQLQNKFGDLKLSEVDSFLIRRWHLKLKDKPYAANRALEVLNKMFNFAEEEGLKPQGTNPCRMVQGFTEKKRKRYATIEEFKKICEILDRNAETRPDAVAFLYLLIFTGTRPSAIERAKKKDLRKFKIGAETYGELTFAGKSTNDSGDDEVIILPPQAIAALDRLPSVLNSSLINCKMPRRLWASIKKEVGCEDLWARDFRRFFASMGKSSGIDMGTIGELLNHKTTQTTKTYAHLFDDKRVEAVAQIANLIEKVRL